MITANGLMRMNRSELEAYESQLSHHPEYYFGIIDDLMDEGFSSGMFGISRDSEQLEISNYETAKAALAKWIDRGGWSEDAEGNDFYDGAVSIESSSHWAVGWVETIHVRMRNRHGEFTKAFRVACEMLAALEQYPVLDEEDYSRREYEETIEYLETEVGEENASECFSWLFENYSASRVDDIRWEWIEEWKQANLITEEQ